MITETSGPCTVVFTGDSAFLYLVIKWTVNVTRVWVKMLVPITSLSQGPRSRGSGSQGPGSWVSGPRSRVPGPGSRVSDLDFRLCHLKGTI